MGGAVRAGASVPAQRAGACVCSASRTADCHEVVLVRHCPPSIPWISRATQSRSPQRRSVQAVPIQDLAGIALRP